MLRDAPSPALLSAARRDPRTWLDQEDDSPRPCRGIFCCRRCIEAYQWDACDVHRAPTLGHCARLGGAGRRTRARHGLVRGRPTDGRRPGLVGKSAGGERTARPCLPTTNTPT